MKVFQNECNSKTCCMRLASVWKNREKKTETKRKQAYKCFATDKVFHWKMNVHSTKSSQVYAIFLFVFLISLHLHS